MSAGDGLRSQRAHIIGPDGEGVGELVFEALVSHLDDPSGRGDAVLRDRIVQRLAYGVDEAQALAESESILGRAIDTVASTYSGESQFVVMDAITHVSWVVNRAVAVTSLGKTSRDRAAVMREEVTQGRLQDGLDKLAAEIGRLESTRPPG